jgi:hypothetical protein
MLGRKALRSFIAARGWARVGEAEWAELRECFPGIMPASLVKAGIAIEQPVRGVEQQGFGELETSLIEMAEVYAVRPDLRRFTREQVIAAKDRARWASRNLRVEEDVRRRKAEMLEWMLVWLDDPAMFETWVRLRRQAMEPGVPLRTQNESRAERDPHNEEEAPGS